MAGEHIFRTHTELPTGLGETFDFFAAAENLERITPPELQFKIVSPKPVHIEEGALIDYRLKLMGISFGWRTQITNWDPPHVFTDSQLKGPYRQWIHTHRFWEENGKTQMTDEVRYKLPLFPLGEVAYPLVRLQVRRIFAYRGEAIRDLLLKSETP
ncbi:MAG: SRPBCC family protein [Candidatus Eisenbacteria bacterium]|uniref:SRPBCC family protein n=1 Tax=Eiseniibacteriota bacterium TaxID=2212470 RepID=A0A7Y2H1K5_UNCEI|nr:SRPBCC family protein [Candidatus Eisenbacteria bacterium]